VKIILDFPVFCARGPFKGGGWPDQEDHILKDTMTIVEFDRV